MPKETVKVLVKVLIKVLVIGDVHIKITNIPEIDEFIVKIDELARNTSPDFIVILGDVLHTHERLHTTCLNKAYILFEKMKSIATTYVLVGNHDFESNQVFLEDKHWMNGVKKWSNIHVIDTPRIFTINNLKFVMMPYVYPGKFIEALNLNSDDWKNSICIFAHQEFYGCKMGAIVSTEGDKWDEALPLVISGHIHSSDWLQNNIYYTGSALQHAFGESEKNTISIFTFEEGEKYTHEEVDLKLPRKKIIYKNTEEIQDMPVPISNDKIRITLSGNHEEFKAFKKTEKYKELLKNNIKVEFKPKLTEKLDKDINMKDTVNFLDILYDKIISEDNLYLLDVYDTLISH